jgi:4-hydroxy-3-methylbut-2-en-1-yl diphosphate synthase IspG/GcpE
MRLCIQSRLESVLTKKQDLGLAPFVFRLCIVGGGGDEKNADLGVSSCKQNSRIFLSSS